ncbi:MAG: transposase [Burkholderia sp.]
MEHGDALWAGIRKSSALMSDGGDVYDLMAQKNKLIHLGCWMHARRYFVEAKVALAQGRAWAASAGDAVPASDRQAVCG